MGTEDAHGSILRLPQTVVGTDLEPEGLGDVEFVSDDRSLTPCLDALFVEVVVDVVVAWHRRIAPYSWPHSLLFSSAQIPWWPLV